MTIRIHAGLVACWAVLMLSACDSVFGPTPVVMLELSADTATLVEGSALQLTAVLRNENGTRLSDRTAKWSSSASTIARVDSTGLVMALAPGFARVVAEADGTKDTTAIRVTVPLAFVSTAAQHSCGVGLDRRVYCWGANGLEAKGVVPSLVQGSPAAAALSASGYNTCAVDAEGRVFCWGRNESGQLGNGTADRSEQPTLVAGGLSFHRIDVGWRHSCAITAAGKAYCWGDDRYGQLGSGQNTDTCRDPQGGEFVCSKRPVPVAGGRAFISISAGVEHTCGIDVGGHAFCWGLNGEGRLGVDASLSSSAVPLEVVGAPLLRTISAGHTHTCALSLDGSAFCWGGNSAGQLGSNDDSEAAEPMRVFGGLHLTALDAGSNHTCGVDGVGVVYCWGGNGDGQLGVAIDESTCAVAGRQVACSRAPVSIGSDLGFASVSAGREHTCAITIRNRAYCWGSNHAGQLGNSAVPDSSSTPLIVSG